MDEHADDTLPESIGSTTVLQPHCKCGWLSGRRFNGEHAKEMAKQEFARHLDSTQGGEHHDKQ